MLVQLDVADVRDDGVMLQLRHWPQPQLLPVGPVTRRALVQLLEDRDPDGPLFISRDGIGTGTKERLTSAAQYIHPRGLTAPPPPPSTVMIPARPADGGMKTTTSA